jgi:hypothetical protein
MVVARSLEWIEGEKRKRPSSAFKKAPGYGMLLMSAELYPEALLNKHLAGGILGKICLRKFDA